MRGRAPRVLQRPEDGHGRFKARFSHAPRAVFIYLFYFIPSFKPSHQFGANNSAGADVEKGAAALLFEL